MTTQAQILAARTAWFKAGGLYANGDDAFRAALEAAERVAWRPIAEAPKDGTEFYGLVGDDLIAMFWHPGFCAFVSSFRRMTMAPGYSIDGQPYKDHSPVVHTPEWWRPLPARPEEGMPA